MLEIITRKPNKFNEIFSTANNFLDPARGENPFVKKSNEAEESNADHGSSEPVSSPRSE